MNPNRDIINDMLAMLDRELRKSEANGDMEVRGLRRAIRCVEKMAEEIELAERLEGGPRWKLKLENPPRVKGVYSTVRLGIVTMTPTFAILDVDGRWVAKGKTRLAYMCRFIELTDAHLSNEHDISCRTIGGLRCALERYYPAFKESDIVSVIEFEVEG